MGRRIDIVRNEAGNVVRRANRMLRSDGLQATTKFFGGLVVEHLKFPLMKKRRARERISFRGHQIPYAYHLYSQTWRNERCLEVAIAKHVLKNIENGRILEVGNVLSHFGLTGHEVIDKYERVAGVRNIDIFSLGELKQYDAAVSISTLEHVRFDEPEKDPRGAAHALERLRAAVRPGGTLLVTVPIGYNSGLDEDIRAGRFTFADQTYYKRVSASGDWHVVSAAEALDCRYGSPYEAANAVLVGMDGPSAG